MRRFLFFVVPLIVVASLLFANKTSLGNLFYKEVIASDIDVVYSAGDLGFVLEYMDNKNCIKYLQGENIIGECVFINRGFKDLNKVCEKLCLSKLKDYWVGEKLVIEGVSAKLDYFIKGQPFNVQIIAVKDKIIIGSPIVYGSY